MFLTITIDTEEEGIWTGEFPRRGAPVKNIQGVRRFQEICDRYDVKPTYLIDYSVATTPTSSEIFCPIESEGRCEIGAHLHPWSTPPFDEQTNPKNSYICNLPLPLVEKKLDSVLAAHEKAFEKRPYSFRAGRWGFSHEIASLLRRKDFKVDTSICPFKDYSSDGGPFFDHEEPDYFWMYPNTLLEIPASVGFNRPDFNQAFKMYQAVSKPNVSALRLVGILSKLNILKLIMLNPEIDSLEDMKTCAKVFHQKSKKVLNLFFHSSDLYPGCSPYVKTQHDLEVFLKKIEQFFEFLKKEWNTQGMTLLGFKKWVEKNAT